jgi:hypothetical protein
MGASFRKGDRELVAADPTRDVGRAQSRAQARRRLGEHAVARQMTDALVDRLEVVDVEDEQGEAAAVAMRARALAQERLVEEPPVAEAGERVGVGEAARSRGSGTRCRVRARRGDDLVDVRVERSRRVEALPR